MKSLQNKAYLRLTIQMFMANTDDLTALAAQVVESVQAKQMTPNSAYTKVAKEVFSRFRSGAMSKEEADEFLEQLGKDLNFSDKIAFHGTSALIENF